MLAGFLEPVHTSKGSAPAAVGRTISIVHHRPLRFAAANSHSGMNSDVSEF